MINTATACAAGSVCVCVCVRDGGFIEHEALSTQRAVEAKDNTHRHTHTTESSSRRGEPDDKASPAVMYLQGSESERIPQAGPQSSSAAIVAVQQRKQLDAFCLQMNSEPLLSV